MLLLAPDQASWTSPLVIEAAGQMYKQTIQLLYLSGDIHENDDLMIEIKRWVRLMWAYLKRFGPDYTT